MFLSRFFYGLSATHKLSSSVAHELSYLWFPVERGGDHETDRDTTGGQEDEISRSIRDMARETLEKHWKSWKRVGKEWKSNWKRGLGKGDRTWKRGQIYFLL